MLCLHPSTADGADTYHSPCGINQGGHALDVLSKALLRDGRFRSILIRTREQVASSKAEVTSACGWEMRLRMTSPGAMMMRALTRQCSTYLHIA